MNEVKGQSAEPTQMEALLKVLSDLTRQSVSVHENLYTKVAALTGDFNPEEYMPPQIPAPMEIQPEGLMNTVFGYLAEIHELQRIQEASIKRMSELV